jgi:cytochrome c oxidase cbb3-type subunit 3
MERSMANVERDHISGQATTGHEWDGIKELDTPLPKWWVYIFWATIVWSIGYWVYYPSWPTVSSYYKGTAGWSSRAELAQDMAALAKSRSVWLDKFKTLSVDEVAKDPSLLRYAMAGGKAFFAENCQPCHGAGGAGLPGYPNLTDDEWIWGGKLADIQMTIAHGARSDDPKARVSEMPKFGVDGTLKADQIGQVSDFVLSLASGSPAAGPGQQLYADNCVACHGEKGEGNTELGAPKLANKIWTHIAGDKASIAAQINNPKHGVMPAWAGRLDETTIKQLAIYVHSLGGGEK